MTHAACSGAPPRSRNAHRFAAAALAIIAVIAADAWPDRAIVADPAPELQPETLRPGYGPRTFDEALAHADRALHGARERLARDTDDWLYVEGVARALAARHRLTAKAADLAEADRLLDRALGGVPWPAGPTLTRAQVSLAMHDLEATERALARFDAAAVPAPADEQAEARSIRCEVAFQRGQLERARQVCGGVGDLAGELRRANLLASSGDPEGAARIVEAQLRRPQLTPQTVATLALQRAALALAQGDWEGSGLWVRAADRAFPGYWLGEAFVAQQIALEGGSDEAMRRFAALAERTGDPDVFGALARLAEEGGRADEARAWAARADAAWDERTRLLPNTYATHHAEHLLLYGEATRAVALAEADHRRRPHPGTIVHFAYALWRTGEPERALEVVRAGEALGFATADMKFVEALALAALGRAAEAGAALAEARRRNPRIDSARQRLVMFGRD